MGEESREVPARRRREKREEVRSRLVAAAVGVFFERGYEGASLERVAEAAGFSKGAVYSNFASKDELFFELVSARIDERLEAVRAATERRGTKPLAGGGGPESAARAAGRALREVGEADPEWQLLFLEFWLRCARN
jgi:AcrR family transcriptional regulator